MLQFVSFAVDKVLWRLRLIRRWLRAARIYLGDCNRYFYGSDLGSRISNYAHREAEALRLVHSLEKGLTMPAPRRVFGLETCSRLAHLLSTFSSMHGSEWITDYGERVAETVARVNADSGVLKPDKIVYGSKLINRSTILASAPKDPHAFLCSRHSVREFAGDPLSDQLLWELVRGAQTAPSVCNRQAGRIRFYNDEHTKARILSLQNGNRGFGQLIPTVAVISCDLRVFTGLAERNQAWIDGGLFAMALVFMAHAKGLGTCFLNWSVLPHRDRELRALLEIPDHEVIITLLGIGEIAETITVTESLRRPSKSVWVNSNSPRTMPFTQESGIEKVAPVGPRSSV
ncbi:MAG: nitroreductase family protein [Planctomycetota bacterium]